MNKIVLTFVVAITTFISYSQTNRKILFIGIDGCRSDVLMSSNTPVIHGLLPTAVYSTDGLCAYKTWSGNGWSSMLTGVWHTKHGVTDNTFAGSNYAMYPDFIARLENFDASLRTISCVHWAPINTTIIQNADVENNFATDVAVKNGAIAALTTDNPDVLFVDFDDVDHAGHSFGFSATIPQYVDSIETTDAYIGEIITAMQNRPNYANEDWLVVVTTDHGGNLAGHGRGSLAERTIFNIYSNPSLAPQQLSRNVITQAESFTETNFASGSFSQPANQAPFLFGAAQDFTIEFWVKPTATYTADPSFVSNKNWDSGLNPGFVISANGGQFWKVNIADGVDRLDIEGGHLEPNVWHHLAVSFDRDGIMTAYEDGAVVGFENMQNIGSINTALPFVINQDGTTTYDYNFQGSYKDIRIWNTVIPNNVLVNWATQPVTNAHPFYNQLLANWKCNENAGTSLLDTSVNANHCAITGAVTRTTSNTNFTMYDYSNTTRETDNAVTALTWMCVPIQTNWNLDGVSRVPLCASLGVNDTSSVTTGLSLLPNPSNDTVTIAGLAAESQYTIYNSLGQTIQSGVVHPGATIAVESLSKGLYYLSVTSVTLKLVKE